jgi:hypothetical protein
MRNQVAFCGDPQEILMDGLFRLSAESLWVVCIRRPDCLDQRVIGWNEELSFPR